MPMGQARALQTIESLLPGRLDHRVRGWSCRETSVLLDRYRQPAVP